ncbi:unnamed protein product [marine sediment metagenome]|uniref:Uncharacterized protein n=1 Tax=marine sediment metagenome TaxID=412755 RepID=X0W6F0_9ZZZZ
MKRLIFILILLMFSNPARSGKKVSYKIPSADQIVHVILDTGRIIIKNQKSKEEAYSIDIEFEDRRPKTLLLNNLAKFYLLRQEEANKVEARIDEACYLYVTVVEGNLFTVEPSDKAQCYEKSIPDLLDRLKRLGLKNVIIRSYSKEVMEKHHRWERKHK